MNNISAIIVAKNHPVRIFDTINSIKEFVSEIIICDIGINPLLKKELIKNPKCQIIEYQRSVPYVELIREETKKLAKNNWILFIDPDEIISNQLINIIKQNIDRCDYFSFPRKNIIMGKWIKHSRWWPDYQVRLFKKDNIIWPKQIHQQPKTQGNEFKVDAKEELSFLHYNYENLDEFFLKMLRYAKAEAQENFEKDTNVGLATTVKKSLTEFISRYFAEDGYKDGMHGFVLAFLQMVYYFIVYFYIWEKKKYITYSTEEIVINTQQFFKQGLYESNHWINKKKLNLNSFRIKLQNLILKIIE